MTYDGQDIREVLIRRVPAEILIMLTTAEYEDPPNISSVQRRTGASYAHVSEVVNYLENEELLVKMKDGRSQRLRLTRKGLMIAALIGQLYHVTRKPNNVLEMERTTIQEATQPDY